jgi:hypothetical protein
MVELLNPRNQTTLSILCIGFVLIASICPTYAATLKDIRVGDYETHTRIVFEHGDTIPHETLTPRASGQLSVLFPDTELDLVRKIPTAPTKHLKEIRIWQHRNELSLLLTFAYEHFRYELAKLDQPKRLVLDVYRMTPSDKRASISETLDAQPWDLQKTAEMSDQPISPPETPTPAGTTKSDRTMALKPDPPQWVQPSEPPLQPAARSGRMQHYLLIGLVVLTLVILVLLLTMLILKAHWAKPGPQFKSSDALKRQDERIAALDAQIQKQLNRFEKG